MKSKIIQVNNVKIGGNNPLAFIAGPCVIENEKSTLKAAVKLKELSSRLSLPLIFKSSYDKANRTSISAFRGPGIVEGLEILRKVKLETGLPLLSDIHLPEEAVSAAEVLDVLQIPAFLCRQSDIVIAAAKTGRPVNIKKGQFMAPHDMRNIIEKVVSTGNTDVMITERGITFGYNNLVVDMRSIPIIKSSGFPVVYDATHSVQLPGGKGMCSGGQREFIEPLARAAVSVGCDAVFIEVHEDPDNALCDGPNMLSLRSFPEVAMRLVEINKVVKKWMEL